MENLAFIREAVVSESPALSGTTGADAAGSGTAPGVLPVAGVDALTGGDACEGPVPVRSAAGVEPAAGCGLGLVRGPLVAGRCTAVGIAWRAERCTGPLVVGRAG